MVAGVAYTGVVGGGGSVVLRWLAGGLVVCCGKTTLSASAVCRLVSVAGAEREQKEAGRGETVSPSCRGELAKLLLLSTELTAGRQRATLLPALEVNIEGTEAREESEAE